MKPIGGFPHLRYYDSTVEVKAVPGRDGVSLLASAASAIVLLLLPVSVQAPTSNII